MMLFIHDVKAAPRIKFTLDLKRTFNQDLSEVLLAVKWSQLDPTVLLAFSREHVFVVIRSLSHADPVFCKLFQFEGIADAEYMPFAANCMSREERFIIDMAILSEKDHAVHILDWQTPAADLAHYAVETEFSKYSVYRI